MKIKIKMIDGTEYEIEKITKKKFETIAKEMLSLPILYIEPINDSTEFVDMVVVNTHNIISITLAD